jgi:hypothetical protein
MTTQSELLNENENKENVASNKSDPFEEMEQTRKDGLPSATTSEEEPEKDKPTKKKPSDENAKKESNEKPSVNTKDEGQEEDIEGSDGNPSEVELLKKDVEKNKKSLLDAQKWGTKNSQKIKYTLKKLNALIENASFTEDEEKEVLDLKKMLESDVDAPFEEDKAANANQHPISKYIDIASEKLGVMKELSDEPESFHKKYRAFEISLLDYKPDEMELLADELDELKDNPVKLAKKIMDIGEQYYNEYYKEFEETGGFRNLIQKRNKENEKLKKDIDKLKKKLLNYEDFDSPKYKIGEDSTVETEDEGSGSSNDPYEQMEQSRNERLKQRR